MKQTIAQTILFFLLFLLPFVVLPFGVSHYETPKVIFAEIGILMMLGVTLANMGKIKFHKTQWLLVGLFFLSVVHVFFFYNETAFLGNAFRLQGIFLFWCLLLFSFLSSCILLPKFPVWIIFGLLLLHLYFAMFGTVNVLGRAVGTVGEPNALAGVVIFLWPWILERVKVTKSHSEKVWKMLGVCIAVSVSGFVTILSGSRSGLAALGVQIIFLLLAHVTSVKKAMIISLIIVGCILAAPLLDKQTVYENRGEIWKTALVAGYEHPFIGWGVGNTEVALEEYNVKLYNRLRGYYVDSSHNFLLDWWVQGGFIGLSLVILLIINALTSYVREKDVLRLCLFLGIMTVMLFNPVSIVILLPFWWLIGVGLTSTSRGLATKPHPR